MLAKKDSLFTLSPLTKVIAVMLSTHILLACGGGSSSSDTDVALSSPTIPTTPTTPPTTTPTPAAPTGTDNVSTLIKSGVITGFGSVIIDGQRFLTENATVNVNGTQGTTLASLSVGMRVTLVVNDEVVNENLVNENADTASLEAINIVYKNDIEGTVSAIDRTAQIITIAGTNISYTNLTHFIGLTPNSLNVNDCVEISGFINTVTQSENLTNNQQSNQQITQFVATYIALDDDSSNAETNDNINEDLQTTTGVVQEFDASTQTFRLNNMMVSFAGVTDDINLNIPSAIANNINGQSVKITGIVDNGVLEATDIEINDGSFYIELLNELDYNTDPDAQSIIEIEGFVSAYQPTANSITVNGLTFSLSEDVNIDSEGEREAVNGESNNLTVGDFVELTFNPITNLVTEIELENHRLDEDGTIKGTIDSIDTAAQTITVNGVVYQFTQATRIEDDDDQYISFSELLNNDSVEIVYAVDADNNLIIQRIEREDEQEFNEEWALEGLIDSIDFVNLTITVNGVVIAPGPDMRLLIDDNSVTLVDMFITLASTPDITALEIEAGGAFDADGIFIVEEIEISADDDELDEDRNDDSDNERNLQVEVELAGQVTEIISDLAFSLNNVEIRLNESTELTVNDQAVTLAVFIDSLTVGTVVEVEGEWREGNTYIVAFEAEIED